MEVLGGIMEPEAEDVEELVESILDTALYIDSDCTAIAWCPFSDHACTVVCPMAIRRDDDECYSCSFSWLAPRGSITLNLGDITIDSTQPSAKPLYRRTDA